MPSKKPVEKVDKLAKAPNAVDRPAKHAHPNFNLYAEAKWHGDETVCKQSKTQNVRARMAQTNHIRDIMLRTLPAPSPPMRMVRKAPTSRAPPGSHRGQTCECTHRSRPSKPSRVRSPSYYESGLLCHQAKSTRNRRSSRGPPRCLSIRPLPHSKSSPFDRTRPLLRACHLARLLRNIAEHCDLRTCACTGQSQGSKSWRWQPPPGMSPPTCRPVRTQLSHDALDPHTHREFPEECARVFQFLRPKAWPCHPLKPSRPKSRLARRLQTQGHPRGLQVSTDGHAFPRP
mmetsp:Transcript_136778/g.272811  ORF Transcript_136778/g.272811 Transcript_136778/m.272811 type:complete len:287 (+) Transcript_136778:150-1010(+)